MAHIPYRTGLTKIMMLLRTICRLIVVFDVPLRAVIPAEDWHYVEDLKACCEAFLNNVYNPRPNNEG